MGLAGLAREPARDLVPHAADFFRGSGGLYFARQFLDVLFQIGDRLAGTRVHQGAVGFQLELGPLQVGPGDFIFLFAHHAFRKP